MTGFSPLSMRDPAGRLVFHDGRPIRIVHEEAAAAVQAFLGSSTAEELLQAGKLIPTRVIPRDGLEELLSETPSDLVLEHDRVWFPSYPYEWPHSMLMDAGVLTLDIAERALAGGYGLKDATPFNVLYRGPSPVFVDWLSFEKSEPGEYLWVPESQFNRTFVLPLLASSRFGVPLSQVFGSHREGLEPAAVYRLCGSLRRLLPPFLGAVTLPTLLAGRAAARGEALYEKKTLEDSNKATFILSHTLRRQRRRLEAVGAGGGGRSHWAEYMQPRPDHYSSGDFARKEAFVRDSLSRVEPSHVLDIGANTGFFSELAARASASVVAIDSDPVVVEQIRERAHSGGLEILSLVVDLARPSPALGWRNAESPSFLQRAEGRFELVLLLGMLHHLLVTERIPLNEVLETISTLTTDGAVIEFVHPADPMFRQITRGREGLFEGLTPYAFEQASAPWFTVERTETLESTHRSLYLLRKR